MRAEEGSPVPFSKGIGVDTRKGLWFKWQVEVLLVTGLPSNAGALERGGGDEAGAR